MKNLKIVVIGGGSSYTPELLEGFIKRYEEMKITELWLVDIEEGKEKLEIIKNLAIRMVKRANVNINIHSTLNRREALKNADFVITQIRVGLIDARILDERISLSHGYMGQETNGAGGIFNGLRTIPVMLEIDKDIEELCPNAWLINFANPSGMVTEALLRYGRKNKKVIGLCNVPIGMEREVARILNVDDTRIKIKFAGLNHMVFGLNIYLDGEDITKEIIEKMASGELDISAKNIKEGVWEGEFIKGIGVIPCPYHKYYFQRKNQLEKEIEEFKSGKTRGEIVKNIEKELFEIYKDVNLDIKPKQLEERGGAYYSEASCKLISSIYNDKKDIQTVNTINNGAISNIDKDSAVEVSCVITKNGPMPIVIGELPYQINGLVQSIKSVERATIKAALSGKYEDALTSLTINPLIAYDRDAKKLLEELLIAHETNLPKFKEVIDILKNKKQ